MTASRSCVAVMLIAAAMLCGCMPEAVKQIESNKSDYMQSHFAVADLAQQVTTTINGR